MFLCLAIHLFETSSGKPMGDGKPVQHSVCYFSKIIVLMVHIIIFWNELYIMTYCSVSPA